MLTTLGGSSGGGGGTPGGATCTATYSKQEDRSDRFNGKVTVTPPQKTVATWNGSLPGTAAATS